jgi:hypothetical protein
MNKMNKKIVGFGVVMGALVAVAGVPQAQAAETVVNLQMSDYSTVAATSSINVTPTLAQIVLDSVTTINNPIALTIDSTNGSTVSVEGDGSTVGASTLADNDLELNAGQGWINVGTGGDLYSSSATQSAANVPVNVRISNLAAYEVGTHSNTVTFTIVAAE